MLHAVKQSTQSGRRTTNQPCKPLAGGKGATERHTAAPSAVQPLRFPGPERHAILRAAVADVIFHASPDEITCNRHKLHATAHPAAFCPLPPHSSAGAYGAHGLSGKSEKTRADWKTANQYHLCHSLALATLPVFQKTPARTASGLLFSAGITLFSGSIYYAGGYCRRHALFFLVIGGERGGVRVGMFPSAVWAR